MSRAPRTWIRPLNPEDLPSAEPDCSRHHRGQYCPNPVTHRAVHRGRTSWLCDVHAVRFAEKHRLPIHGAILPQGRSKDLHGQFPLPYPDTNESTGARRTGGSAAV